METIGYVLVRVLPLFNNVNCHRDAERFSGKKLSHVSHSLRFFSRSGQISGSIVPMIFSSRRFTPCPEINQTRVS